MLVSRTLTRALTLAFALALVLPTAPSPTGNGGPAKASWPAGIASAERRGAAGSNKIERSVANAGRAGRRTSGRDPRPQSRGPAADGACDAPGMVLLPQSGLCTHGSDPAPPGLDVALPVAPLPENASRRAMASLACDGDGQSGPRVQIVYARTPNRLDRFPLYLASIRGWTADADEILRDSAAAAGGDRRFRFVTGAGCSPEVASVVLSPAADDSFDATISELRGQGFDRTDRIYLVFFDTTVAGLCGIGSQWLDDDPSQRNRNNVGPNYARVDAGCWRGDAVAHELMHTLGGVQDSAPNASGGGHCVDDYDLMCYSDPPYYPAVQTTCPDRSLERRFDCGNDDYFDPTAPDGSYLATHWNTATSQFLVGGGSGSGIDQSSAVPSSGQSMGGKKESQVKSKNNKKGGKKTAHHGGKKPDRRGGGKDGKRGGDKGGKRGDGKGAQRGGKPGGSRRDGGQRTWQARTTGTAPGPSTR